jgi:hypothetical protein
MNVVYVQYVCTTQFITPQTDYFLFSIAFCAYLTYNALHASFDIYVVQPENANMNETS